MFPKEKWRNKHKESVHTGEYHTAGDHKSEEFIYRTNLEANYLQHMFNTHTNSYSLDVLAKQNMDLNKDKQTKKLFDM